MMGEKYAFVEAIGPLKFKAAMRLGQRKDFEERQADFLTGRNAEVWLFCWGL